MLKDVAPLAYVTSCGRPFVQEFCDPGLSVDPWAHWYACALLFNDAHSLSRTHLHTRIDIYVYIYTYIYIYIHKYT